MLPGSPSLWLIKFDGEFFINGARVIMRNLQATSPNGKRQRLHILDSVLEPLVPKNKELSSAYVDLTAGKLLRDSSMYNIKGFSIKYMNLVKLFFDGFIRTFVVEGIIRIKSKSQIC